MFFMFIVNQLTEEDIIVNHHNFVNIIVDFPDMTLKPVKRYLGEPSSEKQKLNMPPVNPDIYTENLLPIRVRGKSGHLGGKG